MLRVVELGARRHTGLDAALEDIPFDPPDLRAVPFAGPTDAHRVVRGAPLDHVDARHREDLVELLHRGGLLDHDRDDDVVERLDVARRSGVDHQRGPAVGDAVDAAVARGIGPNGANGGPDLVGRADVGEEHVWKPAPMARSASQTRGSWSSLIMDDMP